MANHGAQGQGGDPAETPRKRAVVAVSELESYHLIRKRQACTDQSPVLV